MKICLIVPGFSADERDWCIPALLDLVRELSRAHCVHVFALRYPHRRGQYTVYGARVHACGGGLAAGFGRLPFLAAALSRIVAEARRGAFDVIHGIWADEPGFLAVCAGRLLQTPAVVSVAGGELIGLADIAYGGQLSRINRWLTRQALRTARQVTAGSHLLAATAATYRPARLAVLPLGVDTRRFSPSPRPGAEQERGRRLVHVASLSPVKDQATLIHAFAQVNTAQPGLVLDLAGDGPLRHSLQALARDLGVGPAVHFRGAVAHDQLPALYRSADLCLLSSRHESQNLAVLEAAACGTPAIGTAVGVLPALASGYTVPVGDAGALAAAILRLLGDEAERRRLGEAQCRLVQERFALARTLPQLTALYEQLT